MLRNETGLGEIAWWRLLGIPIEHQCSAVENKCCDEFGDIAQGAVFQHKACRGFILRTKYFPYCDGRTAIYTL